MLLLLRSKAGAVYYRFCEVGGAIMENQQEIWKDIRGFNGKYSLSNLGSVKNNITDKNLKPMKNHNGYLVVHLWNRKKMSFRIHRIVAEMFIPNSENKKTVNHINGIKTDNRVENLEWSTSSENIKHAFDCGLNKGNCGEKHGSSKLKESDILSIRNYFNNGKKQSDIAKMYKISASQVCAIISRKKWKHI